MNGLRTLSSDRQGEGGFGEGGGLGAVWELSEPVLGKRRKQPLNLSRYHFGEPGE